MYDHRIHRNRKSPGLYGLLAGLALLAGCGKPPSGGGMSGDFPVNAVVAPVEKRALEEKINLVGSLEAIEEVDLVSEVDARVEEIQFEEGRPVQKGQLLIRLDDRKLKAAVADMQARFDLAKANLERSANLLDKETISQQDYDRAEAEFDGARAQLELAQEQLNDATIQAPFDGIMTERMISLGQFTTRGQRLATLVEVNPIEVEFNVPERFIGQIAEAQSIDIRVEAYAEETFGGEVVFISPRVDRQTRTILVKARLDNSEGRLKPGMFGNLELVFEVRAAALVIPEAAISYTGDRASVVVVDDQSKAEFRQVVVGTRLAGDAEILDGLAAGERVVVEGYQKMGPGSTVVVSEESRKYGIDPGSANTTKQG